MRPLIRSIAAASRPSAGRRDDPSSQMKREPSSDLPRVITSTAPVRVCDNGGWTDTWFALFGKVFNIAVRPHVEVQIEVRRRSGDEPHVVVNAENLGAPGAGEVRGEPLIEAAIERVGVPEGLAVRVNVFS